MKRREFLKIAVVGSVGALMGERIAAALSALPVSVAPQDKVAVESCATELEEFVEPSDVKEIALHDEPLPGSCQVVLNGVVQVEGHDFTLSGNVVKFRSPPRSYLVVHSAKRRGMGFSVEHFTNV